MAFLRKCGVCKKLMAMYYRNNFLFHACATCDMTGLWPSNGYEGDTVAA